jgi:hypothetical protein
MVPVIAVSFILSLFLVERRDRVWRVSQQQRAPVRNSIWSGVSIRNWLDPEPYQDPSDSTWVHSGDQGVANEVSPPEKNRWFIKKKHRKMTKLQLGEAFNRLDEMRGTVVLCLIGMFLVVVLAVGWGVKKRFGFGV